MNTQVCTACHEEKPLSEFHRRGVRHHRMCKSCRKVRPTSTPRPVKQFNIQANGERITALDAKLRLIAARYGRDPMQADDIYGYIIEKLLTSIQPEDSDAYILRIASLRAADYIRTQEAYTYYADVEDAIASDSDEDCDVFERFVSTAATPEQEIILREMSAQIAETIASLSPENQQIVYMVADGVKPAEIARRMGISRTAISSRLQTIRSQSMALA